MPALLDLSLASPMEQASVEAIEVDGEPFTSATVGEMTVYRRQPKAAKGGAKPEQLTFFGLPGPSRYAGEAVNDVVLEAMAEQPLTGDERNPLRGDVVQVCRLGHALAGATILTATDGAWFLSGRPDVTAASMKRWNAAMLTASTIRAIVNPRTGQWRNLATIDPRGTLGEYSLMAPAWWREASNAERRWRLTGGLWRPVLRGDAVQAGTREGYWGGVSRTLDGIESALAWSRTSMKGKGGSIAEYLRPENKGRPGPAVFMPWRDVLRHSGEFVPDDADPAGSATVRRWRRRRDGLKAAGYFCGDGAKPAEAGDTVEVVKVETGGGKGREAGLWVRATARFCEAAAKAGRRKDWAQIPARRLLRPGAE